VYNRISNISFLRAYWPAILWGIFILVATLTPGKSLPSSSLFKFDKLIHLFIFFGFTWLVLRGFYLRATNKNPLRGILYLLIALFTILFGILIEIIQNYIPDRSADINDVIANTSGVFLAQLLFYFTHRKAQA
jgi:VanZ family protein